MTIPDPTTEQQYGIDAAVVKANAPIIAANTGKSEGDQTPLYTADSYQIERINGMRDSWASAHANEVAGGLMAQALMLPLEQRMALIGLMESQLAGA